MLLDIVILPPLKLRQRLGKKVREAAKGISSVFVVDNKKFIPHLSLFHIRTSKTRIRNLKSRIREVLKKYQVFKLETLGFYWGGGPGHQWICQEIINPKILARLHEEIIKTCNDLRTGMMPSTSRRLSKLKKYYRNKYGVSHLLKFFRPHFTLGMVKSKEDLKDMIKRMRPLRIKFLADTVAITEVNFWHQVTRVIKRFQIYKHTTSSPTPPHLLGRRERRK